MIWKVAGFDGLDPQRREFPEHVIIAAPIALNLLKSGSVGIIETLTLPDEVQHHLMHMGFVPDARVRAVRRAPAGDPTVYSIDGMEIALRRETARGILVRAVESAPELVR